MVQPAQAEVGAARAVILSPLESIVLIDGVADDDPLTVQVKRNDVVIGNLTGVPRDFGLPGALEVNHAATPTVCWEGSTPQILPGDVVHILGSGSTPATTFEDTVLIPDFNVTEGLTAVPGEDGSMTVKGNIAGPRPPIEQLDVFIRLRNGFDFRAHASEAPHSMTYDGADPNDGTWTATFRDLSEAQMTAAQNPTVLEAEYLRAANEILVAVEPDGVLNPEDPDCPALAALGVTQVSPALINVENATSSISVQGAAPDAASVTVTASDGTTTTTPVVATLSGGTFDATIPAASIAGLEGLITVSSSHTQSGGGVISGTTRTVRKDTVRPAAPTIDPAGGTHDNQALVTLAGEPGAQLRYTTNGTDPTPASGTVYDGGFTLDSAGPTDVRAIAVDAAQNASTVAQASFTIAKPPGLPANLEASKSDGTATLTWAEGPTNHAAIDEYVVRASAPGEVVRQATLPGTARSHTFSGLSNGENYVLSVRAGNSAGDGSFAQTGPVMPQGAPLAASRPRGEARIGSAFVDWNAPDDNGSPITGYTVTALVGDTDQVAKSMDVRAGSTDVTMTGLTNGQAYRFTVTADNAVGTGATSAKSAAVTPREKPRRPRIGEASPGKKGGALTAIARWRAPATSTAEVTQYEVRAYKVKRNGSMVLRSEAVVRASKRAKSMVLQRGNYRFAVRALSAVGNSRWSARSGAVRAR